MKAVLISIKPKWCELIASGKKTVEVRKTKPKIDVPFKCYIYCTHNNRKNALHTYINSGYGRKNFGVIGNWRSGKDVVDVNSHLPAYRYNAYLAEGKVIGEFVCDRITEYECSSDGFGELATTCGTCLTYDEILNYCNGNDLYGWHITDLVIYEQPKELSEFYYPPYRDCDIKCSKCKYGFAVDTMLGTEYDCHRTVTRPPQSWGYVEEGAERLNL